MTLHNRYNSRWNEGEPIPARVRIMDYMDSIPVRGKWLTAPTIATRLELDHTHVYKLLDALVRQGFITKSRTLKPDGRGVTVEQHIFCAVAGSDKIHVDLHVSEARQLHTILGAVSAKGDIILNVRESIREQLVAMKKW